MVTDKAAGAVAAGMDTKHATSVDSNNTERLESVVNQMEIDSRSAVKKPSFFDLVTFASIPVVWSECCESQTRSNTTRLDDSRRDGSSDDISKCSVE